MANSTQPSSSSIITCFVNKVFLTNDTQVLSTRTVIVILNIVISLFGTLFNGLVIMAYYRNHRLRTIQNTLLLLLAITDVSVTAFVQPIYVVALVNSQLGKYDCLLWDITIILSSFFLGLSLVTIAILNMQSYITLAYPYRYQSIITKRRLKLAVIFSWLLITTIMLVGSVFRQKTFVLYCVVSIIVFVILCVAFSWSWTYKLVARHRNVIQATQTPATNESVTKKKIIRSTFTALVLTFGLFACYFLALLWCLKKLTNAIEMKPNVYFFWFTPATTLMYFNSLLNPCLVFWRSSNFRATAKNIFKRQPSAL